MKEAIYTSLKQAYSPLGLGDAVLMGQAEALAALGYVTQDNIDAVVAAQKPFLEQLQKANDARAQSAAAKARESAEKSASEAAAQAAKLAQEARDKAVAEAVAQAVANEQAKAAELAAKLASMQQQAPEDKDKGKGIPEWYAKEKEARDNAFKLLQEQAAKAQEDYRKTVEQWEKQAKESLARQTEASEALKAIQAENDKMKAEKRSQERQAFIASQALGMGIPQYRVDEGFAGLGPDSTDDEVAAALAVVARNIKANMLPEQQPRYPMAGTQPSDAEIKELAKSLVR